MHHLNSIAPPYSDQEEKLNALSHGLGALASVYALVMLLIKVESLAGLIACLMYGLSLVLMFSSSTLYHLAKQPKLKAKLKVIDHSAIYLLIAGTYTPLMFFSIGGHSGALALGFIWSIALLGIGYKCFAGGRFAKLSVITYLLMGWLAIFYLLPLYQALPQVGFWLLVAGGLCFTLGVLFYVAKSRQYTHAIWHLFVLAGCACHFCSIYFYVI